MDKKKITLKEAQQEFIDRNLIPLFDNYNNNSERLLAQTQEGYMVVTTLNRIKREVIPDKFNKSNLYTIQNINLWLKLNNKPFELVSEKYKGSHKDLVFKCLKENCGEHFNRTWVHIYRNQGCPYCSSHKTCSSNCLTTKNPDLAKQWHPTKNGNLTPYDVTVNSNKKVWWLCKDNFNHEWQTTINSRNNIHGCPYCTGRLPTEDYNLLIYNPKLCEEWDYNKNTKKPEEYCPNSSKKVWWICEKGHEWKASIGSRNTDIGCPYCSHHLPSEDYNLLVINPMLCEEWNYKRNKKNPEEYCPGTNQKIWWICKECGFEWEASIANRSKNNGTGCPKCSESKGEKQLDYILTKYNIPHNKQYTFNDLRGINGGLLKYDVPVFWDIEKIKLRCLIEYDGEFHYEKRYDGDDFEILKIHDELKNQYCKNNNIKLLRIPYWEFNNIEEILKNILIN